MGFRGISSRWGAPVFHGPIDIKPRSIYNPADFREISSQISLFMAPCLEGCPQSQWMISLSVRVLSFM